MISKIINKQKKTLFINPEINAEHNNKFEHHKSRPQCVTKQQSIANNVEARTPLIR